MMIKDDLNIVLFFSETPNQTTFISSIKSSELFDINLLSSDSIFEIKGQLKKIRVSLGAGSNACACGVLVYNKICNHCVRVKCSCVELK